MKTEKNRRRRGSILLTVLFVMSILIVLLVGTIALSIAANSRAHVNYSSAQTGITARSVCESTIRAIGDTSPEGRAFAKTVGAVNKDNPGPIYVPVRLQGTGTETLGHINTNNHDGQVEIAYAGEKEYFDPTTSKFVARDVIRFTSTVNMSGVEKTSSIYVMKDYIEKGVVRQNTGGAGFVTISSANLATQNSLFGGSYIKLPTMEVAEKYEYTDKHIDRGFTTPTGGQDQTDVFTLNNSSAVAEADLFVHDSINIHNWNGVIFPKPGTGITVWGDMCFHNNALSHFRYTYYGPSEGLQFNEVPYIYVDGKIFGNDGKIALGNKYSDTSDRFPLNVFCGSIESTHKESALCANIYCMDKGEDSKLVNANEDDKNLYLWTDSVFSQTKSTGNKQVVNGEVCSKGNLTLGKIIIAGDVRVEGDLTIGEGTEIRGDVVVEGDINGLGNLKQPGSKGIYSNTAGSNKAPIPNKEGYYYVYKNHKNEDGKWVHPDGSLIHTGYALNNGDLNIGAWVDSSDGKIRIDSEDDFLKYDTYYPLRSLEDGESYDDEFCNDPTNIDYTRGAHYTLIDGEVPLAEGTTNKFYYECDVTEFISPDDYKAVPNYNTKSSEPETMYAYGGPVGTAEYLKKVGETQVYPLYAERKVVLGLQDGVDPDTTKVTKTLKDVLVDVSNPYDYDVDLNDPETLQNDKVNVLKTLVENLDSKYGKVTYSGGSPVCAGALTSAGEIEAEMNAEGTEKKSYCTQLYFGKPGTGYTPEFEHKTFTVNNATGTETKTEKLMVPKKFDIKNGTADKKCSNTVYIDKSCRLNITANKLDNAALVIDPKGQEILIDILNFYSQNNTSIIINDSGDSPGHVYMVIRDGGALDMSSAQNVIVTQEYNNFLYENIGGALSVNSEFDAEGNACGNLDKFTHKKPILNIYGQKGDSTRGTDNAKLKLGKPDIITANILSPNLDTTISSSSYFMKAYEISSFFYNLTDLENPPKGWDNSNSLDMTNAIFGCLNSHTVDIPNTLYVIYMDNGDDNEDGNVVVYDKDYIYYGLYYDEY